MSVDFSAVFAALVAGFLVSFASSQIFRAMLDEGQNTAGGLRLFAVGLMLLAGPSILVAAAQKLTTLGEWPQEYAVGCYAFGALWAGVLGFCVLALLRGY